MKVDLDELERLHAAATPGEWPKWDESRPDHHCFYKLEADDARLAIALRNAFPALLYELRMRRKQVEEARRAIGAAVLDIGAYSEKQAAATAVHGLNDTSSEKFIAARAAFKGLRDCLASLESEGVEK